MSENFDPYRKWFGIPPEDQPPNHYRLLAIDPFESDDEVIDNAANQRMAFVKCFQAGKHSAESQKILNEIAAARVCLLDREKKDRYDQVLRSQLLGDIDDAVTARILPESNQETTNPKDLWQNASRSFQIPPPVEAPEVPATPLILDDSMVSDVRPPSDSSGTIPPPPLPDAAGKDGKLDHLDLADIVDSTPAAIKKGGKFLRHEVFPSVKSAILDGDKFLKKLAGEDNDIVHNFLRGAVVFLLAFLVLMMLVIVFSGG